MVRKATKTSTDYSELLKHALKNPGVEEVSKLYENYRELSKQISSLSASIQPRFTIITTNSSS